MRMDAASWQGANQAALLGALWPVFAALRRHIGQPESSDSGTQFSPPLDPPSAIDRLAEIFALSPFEIAVLLLCAGVELDSRFAETCASAQGDPRKGYATFGLALASVSPGSTSTSRQRRSGRSRDNALQCASGSVASARPKVA